MDQSLCKLTLVFPPAGSDRIIELMLETDPPIAGFTTWTAEGHGHGLATASISERVRGRVERSVLVAILPRPQLASALDAVRTKAAIPHLTYWVEPIDDFGQLTAQKPAHRFPAVVPAPNEQDEP